MRHKDKRITFTKEVLNGIRVVKLYAWEEAVQKEIERLRKAEIRCLRAATLIARVLNSINASAPFLVAIVCFTWFILSSPQNVLSPQIAFVGLSLFNLLRRPVINIAPTIHFLTKASQLIHILLLRFMRAIVSAKRLNAFLSEQELPVTAIKKSKYQTDEYEATVFFENATLSWGKMKENLRDIDFKVKEGEFHAIVGPFGSGKSTLLSAILGDLEVLAGERVVVGSTAYLPEIPWIMNSSIRANVLYDLDFDKKLYDKVVMATDFRRDIFALPRCDATVVGENGLRLSGGQKARLALARALYQDCDIYLLDKPFANLDAPVARTIYEKTLGNNGILAKKTVILVTNLIHFTKYADCIHIMKAMSLKKKPKAVMFEPERPQDSKKKSLEPIKEGRIPKSVYILYVRALSYRWCLTFVLLLGIRYFLQALSSIWLATWSDVNAQAKNEGQLAIHTMQYMHVYIALGILAIIFTMLAYISCTFASVRASVRLHKPLVSSLLRAPMSFFDKTPSGRILSRLTADLDTVDYSLAINVRLLVDTLMNIAMILVIVCVAAPLLLVFSVPFAVLYFVLLKFFIPSVRQIRRLESQQRSNLLSVLSQNIQGASSIRAFQRLKNTVIAFCEVVDEYVRCRILQPASYCWLTVRLELLGNLLVLFCISMAAFFNDRGYLTAGEVGLCAAYLLSLTDLMNFSVRILGQTEANVVAVERIKEYHELPQEDEWSSEYPLIDAWPHSGEIEIKKLNVRYGNHHALKDVDIHINKGEKIAVIGRTGSGPSTVFKHNSIQSGPAVSICRQRSVAGSGSLSAQGHCLQQPEWAALAYRGGRQRT
ncbi:hypothetical protein WR25_04720 [Diploscapter pachys]|uniref:ABC transmembrane type-1 domain-containing protein n=1 Tax=Diploscapter pachys TaxID=2018661 RepID=A0A2A2L6L1_9BILA|nr:hypothetical protein WR25_04720 [Diploscapter pachys]